MPLNDALQKFQSVTLENSPVALNSDRFDITYVLHSNDCHKLLENITANYQILGVSAHGKQRIHNFYFDTNTFSCFHDFQRGKRSYYIIRKFEYADSGKFFLEIESKDKLGKTIKARKTLHKFEPHLDDADYRFITSNAGTSTSETFEFKIKISYDRVTLINKDHTERVTIDNNFLFEDHAGVKALPHLNVICVKRSQRNQNSDITIRLKENLHRPMVFSKYCTGLITLDHAIKMNNYKASMLKIQKIIK